MDCPSCGAENPESFRQCPSCGAVLSQDLGGGGPAPARPEGPQVGLWIGLGVGLIVLGVLWSLLGPRSNQGPASSRAAAQVPEPAPRQTGRSAGAGDIPTSEKQAVAQALAVNVVDPAAVKRSVGGARQAASGMTEDAQRTLDQADELLNPKAAR